MSTNALALYNIQLQQALDYQLQAGITSKLWQNSKEVQVSPSTQVKVSSLIDPLNLDIMTSDNAITDVNQSVNFTNRFLSPVYYGTRIIVNQIDQSQQGIDPNSTIAESLNYAGNRYQDMAVLNAIVSGSTSGTILGNGPTVPFDPTMVVPVDLGTTGTPTGLTPQKIQYAQALLMNRDDDYDRKMHMMVLAPFGHYQMSTETVLTSGDFQDTKMLGPSGGMIRGFSGMSWITSNLMNDPRFNASAVGHNASYALALIWTRDAIVRGTWVAPAGKIEAVPASVYDTYAIMYRMGINATRVNEGLVAAIVYDPAQI